MDVQGIDVVFFWVADVERSVAWYTQVLGIEAGPRYGDWQEFRVSGPTRFAVHGGAVGGETSNAVVAFRVADLGEAMRGLADRGVEPVDSITDTGSARFVTYVDPDGNRVQVLERPT